MRIGVCTSVDKFGGVAVEGLDYVELSVREFLCPDQEEQSFVKQMDTVKTWEVSVEAANCLFPPQMKVTGQAVDNYAVDKWMRTVCRRAKQAGIELIVFGSGRSRSVPEGFEPDKAIEQIYEHLKRWADIAADAGVTIVVEPLSKKECNLINNVDEALELVHRVNHPNIRLLVDTCHMRREGESAEAIHRADGLIAHVHCAEGKTRLPIGLGEENHRSYFRALKEIGYNGRISIEAIFPNFPEQLPLAVSRLRREIENA